MQCDAVTRITINILLTILIFKQKGINEYVFSNITFRSISLISVLTVLFLCLVTVPSIIGKLSIFTIASYFLKIDLHYEKSTIKSCLI